MQHFPRIIYNRDLFPVILVMLLSIKADCKNREIERVIALKHRQATLLCPFTPAHGRLSSEPANALEDSLKLVYFYKGASRLPLITLDARVENGNDDSGTAVARRLTRLRSGASLESSKTNHSMSGKVKTTQRHQIELDWASLHAKLIISKVAIEDEGFYRCRVDYRRGPTTRKEFELQLIVPPEKLLISDLTNPAAPQRVKHLLGPYSEEAENVTLLCETDFVKPMPTVLWYENGTLIDNTHETVEWEHERILKYLQGGRQQGVWASNGTRRTRHRRSKLPSFTQGEGGLVKVANRLSLRRKLTRVDYRRQFRCLATNSELAEPVEELVTLDMNLRPVTVLITGAENAFRAGFRVNMTCTSTGSRPVAQLSWYKKGEHLSRGIEGHYNADLNQSVSVLHLTPSHLDHRAQFECYARNIRLDAEIGTLRDWVQIKVNFPPQVSITQVTPKRDPETGGVWNSFIKEEGKLLLRCSIRASPSIGLPVRWFFNGSQLNPLEASKRHLIVANDSLTITRLRASLHNGNYSCHCENAFGGNFSEPFHLIVEYAPKCKVNNSQTTYGIGVNETATIVCQTDAHPPPTSYAWYTNGTSTLLNTYRTRDNFTTFRPSNRFEYGTVSCLPENRIGPAETPCTYALIPHGRPDPVKWCTVVENSTTTTTLTSTLNSTQSPPSKHLQITLKCSFDFTGGLPTTCRASIHRTNDFAVVWSGSSHYTAPSLDGLTNGCFFYPTVPLQPAKLYNFTVFTENAVGRSASYVFASKVRIKQSYGARVTDVRLQSNLKKEVSIEKPKIPDSKENNLVSTVLICSVAVLLALLLKCFTPERCFQRKEIPEKSSKSPQLGDSPLPTPPPPPAPRHLQGSAGSSSPTPPTFWDSFLDYLVEEYSTKSWNEQSLEEEGERKMNLGGDELSIGVCNCSEWNFPRPTNDEETII